MEFIVICLSAFIISALTLFSGFGLGTILMPTFALFFPINIAITLTANVHFLNNVFKVIFMGKYAERIVVFKFGFSAVLFAFLGAWTLLWFSELPPLLSYQFLDRGLQIIPVKFVVSIVMIFFALFELIPKLESISFDKKYLPIGGALSGFFGGLSGHQGALRSAFLIRSGLSKEGFIGTGVVIACMVDVSRIIVYGKHFSSASVNENLVLFFGATLSAFLGVIVGKRMVQKLTLKFIRTLVSVMLFTVAVGLGMGLI